MATVSQPGIHRCLRVSELVSMICDRVEKKPDLLHLALTCRHLCPASLNSLWADTRLGIVALLRCFPEHVLQVHTELGGLTGPIPITLKRLPTLEEWDRVRFYSCRMKDLDIREGPYRNRWAPEEECYRLLLDHWPFATQDLFPQVRSVDLEVPNPVGAMFFKAIVPFLKPPLSDLRLVIMPHSYHDPFLEGCLDTCAETLTDLHVFPWLEGVDVDLFTQTIDYVGNAFIACSALRIVQTDLPLPSAVMKHLASLTNLTDLTFAFHANYRSPQLLEPHPENFRPLRRLSISLFNGAELDDLCIFLSNLCSPVLDTLIIEFSVEPLVTHLFGLVRTIARLGSLRSLTLKASARYTDHMWQPEDPDDWPISCSRILEVMSPLWHLRELDISGLPLHITGTDIERVGRAWPDLEVLDLSAEDEYTTTTVSTADLYVLAAACPRLRKVQLQVIRGSSLRDVGGGGGDIANQYPYVDFLGLYTHGNPQREFSAEVMESLLHMFPHAEISYTDMAQVQKRTLEDYGIP